MTEKKADAIAFLERAANPASGYTPAMVEHSQTILAMLAEPRLPKEPSEEIIKAMIDAWVRSEGLWHGAGAAAYRALYAHLTPKPKRKMIRIRAKGIDLLVEPPVSQSEVEVDQ